ncbi:hypothetical protein CANCADRAFT_31944 [Tortispora caseinolytica NRRL Y-17796]|uniref:Uncharacterized protein n=1 Tax=Tortispora caseinolytica NRRL Y-17796 TaxID=767744 RepID=A0A1E4THM5_9ASCO|nr:hypothetical protein CANCADRAFT_31944 [Tortispora caseinolytica NRRL Y-17796]
MNGNYPEEEFTPAQFKDPYAKYDDPQLRRNFGDYMPENAELYDFWSPEMSNVDMKKGGRDLAIFVASILGFTGLCYTVFAPERPAVKRSYPDGLYKELGGYSDGSDKSDIMAAREA